MSKLFFKANLNLKSTPNELIIQGYIHTKRNDDGIVIQKADPQGIIDIILLLNLNIIEGNEQINESAKPFIYKLNDESAKNYTNVTIIDADGESHTEMVKIFG